MKKSISLVLVAILLGTIFIGCGSDDSNTSSVGPIDLNSSLVVHYEFENNTNDSSKNKNNAAAYGGVTYENGIIGRAASFDGVTGYIDTDGKMPSDATNGEYLTYSAWIKPQSCDSDENLIPIIWDDDKQDYGDRGIGLTKDNNICKFTIFRKSDGFGDLKSTDNRELNKWQLVTFVLDGNDNKTIYINGINVGVSHTSNNYDHSGRTRIVIGSGHDGYVGYFKGLIDDVRVYNRALKESEVQDLYKLGQL